MMKIPKEEPLTLAVLDDMEHELKVDGDKAAAPAKPIVGYVFELARSVHKGIPVDDPTRYCNWGPPQFSFTMPNVPAGSIRNLRPLVDA